MSKKFQNCQKYSKLSKISENFQIFMTFDISTDKNPGIIRAMIETPELLPTPFPSYANFVRKCHFFLTKKGSSLTYYLIEKSHS